MNAEGILQRIDQDAREGAATLLNEARAKAEALRSASEARTQRAQEAALEKARADALALDDRMQRMAKLDARKALLAAKREVLDEAFDRAQAKMGRMDEEQARAFGLAMLMDSAAGDETLIPDVGSKWADQAFVDAANAALANAGKPGRITLSGETRALGGGFVLARGGMEVNCSFPAALAARRMDIEAEVASMLFES